MTFWYSTHIYCMPLLAYHSRNKRHFYIPPRHEDVMQWKRFPHYWPFVKGIHRPPVDSPHKEANNTEFFSLLFSLNKRSKDSRVAGDWSMTLMWRTSLWWTTVVCIAPSTACDPGELHTHTLLAITGRSLKNQTSLLLPRTDAICLHHNNTRIRIGYSVFVTINRPIWRPTTVWVPS